MRITIETVKTNWQGPSIERRELECSGSGTKADPAIIEHSETLPNIIRLVKTNLFITIQNCDLPRIWLISSQNITIENCKVRVIILEDCSNIFCKKSTINKSLRLYTSQHVKIENCIVNKLKINESNSNVIRNSTIMAIKYVIGRDNVFEANNIPEKHLARIKKRPWFNKANLKMT